MSLAHVLALEVLDTTTGLLGVWQDCAREHGYQVEDVSGDVVKAVNDAAQRVSRYRMRALTWDELQELGVGLFGRGTYEAWSGNSTISPPEPFTLAKFKQALLLLKGERCPMRGCEDFDCVQREVPQHVSDEEYAAELAVAPDDFAYGPLGRAFRTSRHEPDGYTERGVLDYVCRVLNEQPSSAMGEQIRRYAEAHREPDGRIDRVTVAAQVAVWMAHPSMEIFLANAARHRDASRRRWDERTRPRHPELVFPRRGMVQRNGGAHG